MDHSTLLTRIVLATQSVNEARKTIIFRRDHAIADQLEEIEAVDLLVEACDMAAFKCNLAKVKLDQGRDTLAERKDCELEQAEAHQVGKLQEVLPHLEVAIREAEQVISETRETFRRKIN